MVLTPLTGLPGAWLPGLALAAEDVNGPEGLTLTAHVFLAAGALTSLGFILWLLRHRKLRGKYAMLWLSLGLGLLVLAVFPQLLSAVSSRLGIYYAPALFLVVAIGFLLVIVIQFSWELSRMEDHTRTLAEELALLRAELSPPEHTSPDPEHASPDPEHASPEHASPDPGPEHASPEHAGPDPDLARTRDKGDSGA